MADIESERAWMQQRARRQSAENAEADRRRWKQERARQLARCSFCFHPRHHFYLVSASITDHDVVYDARTSDDWDLAALVQHCRTDGCICGVPPCSSCGSRQRRHDDQIATVEVCIGCGAEWLVSPIA